MKKIFLYLNTIKYLKISQIYHRALKMAGIGCTIGVKPSGKYKKINPVCVPQGLDFDFDYLKRYDAYELLENKITLLNTTQEFIWNQEWYFDKKTPLWNYNLHYFDYLFSLIEEFRKTGNREFFEKTIFCIDSWIKNNPVGCGIGWDSYTIDIRLTNWLSYYSIVRTFIPEDFEKRMIKSIYEQYNYLSHHIEKDILGNHYFEDLKVLVLCSVFFDEKKMLKRTIYLFEKECLEEVLEDGMHFELSPMYHKIILEDVIRVICALRGVKIHSATLESILPKMLDVAWSLEEGLERIPLFNDGGNNVAKSLDILVRVCEKEFNLIPNFRKHLSSSGYYIFKWEGWKMIIDAGRIGPDYIPGHSHCDAMSFELFHHGKPIIVNCGTYAYQCAERSFFRSTSAHNTIMINGVEQSQCWGNFRVAKRSNVEVIQISEAEIFMKMTDQKKQSATRRITIEKSNIHIEDQSMGNNITTYLHVIDDAVKVFSDVPRSLENQLYSEEYGRLEHVKCYSCSGLDKVACNISLV